MNERDVSDLTYAAMVFKGDMGIVTITQELLDDPDHLFVSGNFKIEDLQALMDKWNKPSSFGQKTIGMNLASLYCDLREAKDRTQILARMERLIGLNTRED